MILDAHLHIWDPSVLDYGWLTAQHGGLYRHFDLAEANRGARQASAATAAGGFPG